MGVLEVEKVYSVLAVRGCPGNMAGKTVVDQSTIEKDWARRGYSCGLWVDPPGQLWEDYVHDVDELLMVVEGRLRLVIAGKTRKALPGEEFFIPAKALHTVENIGGTTARWLYGYKTAT